MKRSKINAVIRDMEKLIQEHIGILEDRYPEFMKATHLYCM